MQTNHFISYLTNPESINELTENSVNTLTNHFPFCQIGQTLNTIYLNNNNSLLFEQQLKKAAIYSSDRKRLFEQINTKTSSIEEKPATDESQEIENIEISNPIESTVIQIEPEIKVAEEIDPLEKNYISAAVSSSYLLEAENVISEEKVEKEKPIEEPKEIKPAFNEDVAHSFKDWLLHIKGDKISNDEIKTTTKKKIHLDVIDKFIQEDPQIKPKKSEFYSPINMARLSVVDDSDMVSETLALIYVEQGNYSNAINTYQKLSLKNPEKRSYFANQIKILKQKIK